MLRDTRAWSLMRLPGVFYQTTPAARKGGVALPRQPIAEFVRSARQLAAADAGRL